MDEETLKAEAQSKLDSSALMWFVCKWDWMIYRFAYGTMRRMCERDPAFALLLKRWIDEWHSKNPMSKTVEDAANSFFEECRDYENKKDSNEQF